MCCGGNMKGQHDGGQDCCFGGETAKDRVCCKFSLSPGNATQTIYLNNTGQCIFASGTISLGCSTDPAVIASVTFLNGTTQVGPIVTLGEESCLTFTAARFTSIQISAVVTTPITGNICISPRYQLHV